MRKLELLCPAANADIAIQAIIHGADAVYIGAYSYGARKTAGNSIEDIKRVVDFAHQFRAKVYVTVNTIVYDTELKHVELLCRQLYTIGVDALIVQDMSLLRLNLPPIALHASTQCDIRTPEKARFLQDVGFSQLVLARELTLQEINKIFQEVNIPIEAFIHGALCVSYSGKCHISQFTCGRSANRGECAQLCRLPYDLIDSDGKILASQKHLLSLKDLNRSNSLEDLIESGVSSFKIEGRLKDVNYVKNITAFYRKKLDVIIQKSNGRYIRSSYGSTTFNFEPNLTKSFNRGFTDYFLYNRRSSEIASVYTPKSLGEEIKSISQLSNGDGISYFDKHNIYQGTSVNGIDKDSIITPNGHLNIKGLKLYRTFDKEWNKKIKKETAIRKIKIELTINDSSLYGKDERGIEARVSLDVCKETANKPYDPTKVLEKIGNTIYEVININNDLSCNIFIPASQLTAVRNHLLELMNKTNKITYIYETRLPENKETLYPTANLDYKENIVNRLAEKFYKEHGAINIEKGIEVNSRPKSDKLILMTTRYCILRELGLCKKKLKDKKISEPLYLRSNKGKFQLNFACDRCEMEVLFK